jgi:hypothetical protein
MRNWTVDSYPPTPCWKVTVRKGDTWLTPAWGTIELRRKIETAIPRWAERRWGRSVLERLGIFAIMIGRSWA